MSGWRVPDEASWEPQAKSGSQPGSRVVKVSFLATLPEDAPLLTAAPGDPWQVDAIQALKDLFGFTGIAHLAVTQEDQ